MKKEKLVTVSCCDFCIREDCAVWKCVHCEKEGCDNCGLHWSIYGEQPRGFSDSLYVSSTINMTVPRPKFSGFVCNECSHNEMGTHLVRFGFFEQREDRAKRAAG